MSGMAEKSVLFFGREKGDTDITPLGFTPKETSVNEVHEKEMKAPSEETKKGWIKELCTKNRVNFVSLQETKLEHIELVTINKLWDNSSYDYAFSSSLELHDIISLDLEEMAHKAKVCWAIEGDENSKYFLGILNNKHSHLAIRDDLERTVSIEEIKRAVWDCGTNKSPGLDGFTFEFFRRYWKFFENDISVAIIEFFSLGIFPKGCNSSFISLIPKTHNVKTVKDFYPISLIGSLYKIIAKILANRLSSVIPDLISDVQSAIISNRQILDGPFILNELL
nr:RNA-directed DNA polymerase, eukaryota, reverse transcriptase zinc-binding domain protein [Tanacetum cinerariifolium]